MHLTKPAEGLRAMRSLVKPGGHVVCEEMDLDSWVCDPPTDAMDRFFALNQALGQRRGENFNLGVSLHRLFREAGFTTLEVGTNFAMALRGRQKRLLPMTFAQFAPELVREGLATEEETNRIASGMFSAADDETTLFGFPLVVQVWGAR